MPAVAVPRRCSPGAAPDVVDHASRVIDRVLRIRPTTQIVVNGAGRNAEALPAGLGSEPVVKRPDLAVNSEADPLAGAVRLVPHRFNFDEWVAVAETSHIEAVPRRGLDGQPQQSRERTPQGFVGDVAVR